MLWRSSPRCQSWVGSYVSPPDAAPCSRLWRFVLRWNKGQCVDSLCCPSSRPFFSCARWRQKIHWGKRLATCERCPRLKPPPTKQWSGRREWNVSDWCSNDWRHWTPKSSSTHCMARCIPLTSKRLCCITQRTISTSLVWFRTGRFVRQPLGMADRGWRKLHVFQGPIPWQRQCM